VTTACVRPESFSSIRRASSEVRGLPKIWPSSVTSVSAAITIDGHGARRDQFGLGGRQTLDEVLGGFAR